MADPQTQTPDETCPGCGGDATDNWFDRSLCACGRMHTCCRNCGAALDSCDYAAPMRDPQAQDARCHCGQPATRKADPDPFEGRMDGYCDACSWARCDCYPDECPVKYPPSRTFVRQEPRPVPQAQDAHAAALARIEAFVERWGRTLRDHDHMCQVSLQEDYGVEGLASPACDCGVDDTMTALAALASLRSRLVVLEQERDEARELADAAAACAPYLERGQWWKGMDDLAHEVRSQRIATFRAALDKVRGTKEGT